MCWGCSDSGVGIVVLKYSLGVGDWAAGVGGACHIAEWGGALMFGETWCSMLHPFCHLNGVDSHQAVRPEEVKFLLGVPPFGLLTGILGCCHEPGTLTCSKTC